MKQGKHSHVADRTTMQPADYADWLAQLKADISRARQRAALAVNSELVQLYWRIGSEILQRQQAQGWGAKVVDRLASDLKQVFPDMRGWSSSNLKYMRFFAQHCPASEFGQQAADQLPWFHVLALLTQIGRAESRAGDLGSTQRKIAMTEDQLKQEAIRAPLLPRLVSGQLRLPEAESFIEEAIA